VGQSSIGATVLLESLHCVSKGSSDLLGFLQASGEHLSGIDVVNALLMDFPMVAARAIYALGTPPKASFDFQGKEND